MRRHTRRLVHAFLAIAVGIGFLVSGAPSSSAVDVYQTPGKHSQNGRDWLTSCEKYSSTVDRCTTKIWHNTVTYKDGKFTVKPQWAFNNLTYKKSQRSTWAPFNPLVTPGEHLLNGRKWKTECDTAWTGSNGCRSQIWATVPEWKNGRYENVNKWVFNNIVHVTPVPCPVSQTRIRSFTGQPSIVTSKCTVSKKYKTWLAVEYVTSSRSGGLYTETAIFARRSSGWGLEFKTNPSQSSVCAELFRISGAPLDLADSMAYCFKG